MLLDGMLCGPKVANERRAVAGKNASYIKRKQPVFDWEGKIFGLKS